MNTIIAIAAGILIIGLFFGLLVWSLCAIASDADQRLGLK